MRSIGSFLLLLFLAVIGALTLVNVLESHENDSRMIPVPPPGYEYCTDGSGERLDFCKKGSK